MSLWIDRYKPTSALKELDFNQELNDNLSRLAASPNFPHLLLVGPSGSGKKTRIQCLLKEIYGLGVEKLKIETKKIKLPTKSLEFSLVSSNHHLEVNPSELGSQDRVVIQSLIKEISQTKQVDIKAKRAFKVVVINDCEQLSKPAQHALRRTMEKYMQNIRLILTSSSLTNIISPIKSRCLLLKSPSPTKEKMAEILFNVTKAEDLVMSQPTASRIVEYSKGDLRKALLVLEATHAKNGDLSSKQIEVPIPDWEHCIIEVASMILKSQSTEQIIAIRSILYDLLARCVPGTLILKTLVAELVKRMDELVIREIVEQAALSDYRMQYGQKMIFHLEAFVAKAIYIYKTHLNKLYDF